MQVHTYIKGVVVGVFFRKFAKEEANRVGVTGWIRNVYGRSDIFGSSSGVEAVIQGSKQQVDEMISWLHKGPSMARVDGVIIKEEIEIERFHSFKIV